MLISFIFERCKIIGGKFSFSSLKMASSWILVPIISDEKSTINLIEHDLYLSLFSLASFKIPSLALAFYSLWHLVVNLFKFILLGICWASWICWFMFFIKFGNFQPLLLQILFPPLSCLACDSHYAVATLDDTAQIS